MKRVQTKVLPLIWWGAVFGIPLGLGAFAMKYAEGTSYFSADPKACINCHIMEPQFDSWQKSSHHAVATCVDCHLPHDFVGKYIAKAENGWHHSKGFTLQNFHEPIMIKTKNRGILLENCRSCHSGLLHGNLELQGREPMDCIHCHRGAGHGLPAGLGGPWKPYEADLLNLHERASHD